MQLILHHVDSAPNPRAVAAAIVNIAHFSAMRDEGQRARVRRLGTSRLITVKTRSVGINLEEALSNIIEDAEDPAFVLEETLLSTANLEVVSESKRRAWSTGRTVSFKIRI